MAEIKYTQEGQDRRLKEIEFLKKRLKHISNLGSGKQGSFWSDLKSVLEGNIEVEQNAKKRCGRDSTDSDISDSKVRLELVKAEARESAFEFIIDLVEKSQDQADHLKSHIKNIEDTYREAKLQLA